jgi:hypothetical protein
MGRRRVWALGVLTSAVGLTGCGTLLGLDEFEDAPPSGVGGGATGSTASSGATGTGGATATSTGSGGGTGGGMACSPGSKMPCYTGPTGTDGMGLCVGGEATCDPSGAGYGDCVGEVLPATDSCATPEDEDCTGASNEGCPCTPGDVAPCYGGPAGTDGVGLCVAGQQTCAADGMGYGACVGEVQPVAADDCEALGDEDCDGYACSEPIWVQSFPGSANPYMSLAGDSTGGVYVAGQFTTTLQLPGVNLIPSGSADAFVFRLNHDGSLAWAKSFGDAASNGRAIVATSAAGEVAIAQPLNGSYSFGGGVLTTAGSNDFAVAKFDSAGNHLWSKRFGDASSQMPHAIALGAAGDVFVAGEMAGSMTFNTTLTSAGGTDIVIARLSGVDGSPVWANSFGDASNQGARGIALDPAGNVLAIGTTDGAIAFGGAWTVAATGAGDGFVARFDGSGATACAKVVDFSGSGNLGSIAATSLGDGILGGDFQGSVVVGGAGGKNLVAGAGFADVFAASVSPLCVIQWATAFSGAQSDLDGRVVVDGADNLQFVARTAGAVDFGGGPLTTLGNYDIVSAKLTAQGQHMWSRIYGTAIGNEVGASIAVTAGAERILALPTQYAQDLGSGQVPAGLTVALFAP